MTGRRIGPARVIQGLCLLMACGCATTGEGRPTTSGPITRAELDSVNAFVVDEAVELLRPTWMVQLRGGCYEEEVLSMDGLSRLPLHQIQEIRLISASEAVSECGLGRGGMLSQGPGNNVLLLTRRR